MFSSFHKVRDSNYAADHAGINKTLLQGNKLQVKGMLNNVHKNSSLIFSRSLFNKRCFSRAVYVSKTHKRKVLNNIIKMEIGNNNANGQNFRNVCVGNQRHLKNLKGEILSETNRLTPLLVNCIEQEIWPMLKFDKEIKNLVKKRQEYLSILSNQYGLRSISVMQQLEE